MRCDGGFGGPGLYFYKGKMARRNAGQWKGQAQQPRQSEYFRVMKSRPIVFLDTDEIRMTCSFN